ncbi:hypothetical protein F5146DRAFT_1144011 [Armillaria mellea]|nr:hypothetical protein F5146DRAFT_1144011 [Armillaria mellea]
MDKAHRNVCSTDISTLKKAMKESQEWDPPFKLGRLICPITLDWDAEERDLLSGDVDFATGDWPYFFFTNEKPPGDDVHVVLQTFLQGELLVQGYHTIFRGPSSTIKKNAWPTWPGNAQIHELTEVTIPSIAYIAVLLHHVFLSDPSFILGAGNFDHQGFYNAIIRWVDQVMPSEAHKDLLKWWNEQVFGDMPKESRKKAKRNGVLWETMEDRMTKMLAVYEKENRVCPPLEEVNL